MLKTSKFEKRIWIIMLFIAAVTGLLHLMESQNQKTNPFEYDLEPIKKTDPTKINYVQVDQIQLKHKKLYGLAVGPKDRIYVTGDNKLSIFDHKGGHLQSVVLDKYALCLAVSPQGYIYLGMSNYVQIYSPKGKQLHVWPDLNDQALFTGIAVTEKNVIVADAGNKRVLWFDCEGRLLKKIGKRDPEKGKTGFIVPSPFFDLALGTQDDIWVTNPGKHMIENYSIWGKFRSSWGKAGWNLEGFCGCCNPTHLAVMSDGRFVTSEKGLPRVKIYDQTGTFQSIVAEPKQFDEGTKGLDLAVDSENRILVLDPVRHAVRVFQEHILKIKN